ncbi:MAG: double-stranded DNA-binding protein [Candidatus Caldarchaeum sp.]|nr:double-stranded DNA-binding protein [Candidatus Caldarchaeum sp.]MCX8200579.1 double-stranded DNA-binding protein [Candidatus Caldarchaeum sp.]MDW8434863.1 hypothetical protein [Candidatus Caldarchaeum sp.]
MSEDLELKRLQLKRMMKIVAQLSQGPKEEALPPPPTRETPLEIVRKHLDAKGLEVLQTALDQYPAETNLVVEKLAELIKSGKISETIDAGDLYNLFRSLGIRVKVETKIQYVKRGEAKDLRELFKQ